MQQHCGARAGLCKGARAVGRLALCQHRTAGQHDCAQWLRGMPGPLPGRAHLAIGRRGPGDVACRIDPASAELGDERPRARRRGGEPQRDRIPDIDQAELGIEQAQQAPLALDLGRDGCAAQQRRDDADIFLEIPQPDRVQPHCPPPGEAGADAEIDPSGGELVQRSQRIGGHRSDAVRRDQHAGAEPDSAGLQRGGRHRDERIGAQHLRVVEPGAGKAQFLGAPHDPPGFGVGRDRDRELHGLSPQRQGMSRRTRRNPVRRPPSLSRRPAGRYTPPPPRPPRRRRHQRFEYCGRLRALCRPYFLRSTTRLSRVRKPSFFRIGRSAGS